MSVVQACQSQQLLIDLLQRPDEYVSSFTSNHHSSMIHKLASAF
jgi:hypothetical protein